MNHIKVMLFTTLRDRAGGKKFLEIEVSDGTTVQGLKDQIARDYPSLKEAMETVLVAIDRTYAFNEDSIPENAEVAMFPPVSGG